MVNMDGISTWKQKGGKYIIWEAMLSNKAGISLDQKTLAFRDP